ncbi:MAG: hypothetical protein J6A08_02625, partial [Lachnospiraceae bacterium]|nr:hypothetical protein [Lachnospiraceae bacterium]
MAFSRITSEDTNNKGVTGLPAVPALETTAMQKKFDELSTDVLIPKFNALADELEAEEAGANIGASLPEEAVTELPEGTSHSVQNFLMWLYGKAQKVVSDIGQVREWCETMFQPKGEYLTEIPEEYANVQSDWNEEDSTSDAYIKNKPESLPASDVHEWAKAETKPSYTAEEVGADASGAAAEVKKEVLETMRGSYTPNSLTGVKKNVMGVTNIEYSYYDVEFGMATVTGVADLNTALQDVADKTAAAICDVDSRLKTVPDAVEEAVLGDAKAYTDEQVAGLNLGESNVQSDWDETDSTSDAYIKNKPESLPASDVHEWAKAETKPSYTAEEVGADASGAAATALSDAKAYTDKKVAGLSGGSTGGDANVQSDWDETDST